MSAGEAAPRYSPAQLARLLGTTEPTAEQAAVISAPLVPMAVIAGAGSGKSETIAARLVWLVANGMVRPERVLGLTFTRKAAAELAERVSSRLDRLRRAGLATPGSNAAGESLDNDPVIATYHSYAGRLVASHALREALEPSVRLITPAVAWQLAARIVAAYDGPMDQVGWTPSTVTAAVLDLAAELAEHLRDPRELVGTGQWLATRAAELDGRQPALVARILASQRIREQLLPLVAGYAAAKAAREVIDYGDQMALAARIASRHPEVGAAERARYQVVLLDEYQDTSHAQLVLLSSLFGAGHPVTAVGDSCQSIYGWRGASAGNLRRFAADFPGAAGRQAPAAVLSTSFRNTGRILDAAASIQQGLRAMAPEVPVLAAPPDRAARGTLSCALLETAAAEADWVADQVGGLLRLPPGAAPDGLSWPDGRPDLVRPRDVAILCRKRAQFPALRAALEARGIPVEVVGLGGLLTVPEVADIVATLRVMHDPAAGDALARLLTSPRWRIGPADLVALGRRARQLARGAAAARPATGRQAGPESAAAAAETGREPAAAWPAAALPATSGPTASGATAAGLGEPALAAGGDALTSALADLTAEPGSLVEALDDLGSPAAYSTEGHRRLATLAAELRTLRGHAGRPLAELVTEVERVLGLDIEVAARPGADPVSSRADLDAFADAAAAFAGDRDEPTLGAFLAYLAAAETEEFGLEAGRVGDSDSVKLATVHAAKGLQWPAVVVPGLAGGRQGHVFPARPRVTTRWTENPRLVPFSLRGDAADLPGLPSLAPGDLARFADECAARDLAEERRLAYVAMTRASFWLACSGYWWGDGTSRLGPCEFLTEIRSVCEAGAGRVAHWEPEPEAEAGNPALIEPATATWPVPADAVSTRYAAIRAGADLVTAAMTDGGQASLSGGAAVPTCDAAALNGDEDAASRYQAVMDSWAADADLLLAERAQRRGDGAADVELPRQIAVSSLVTMARDPADLAQQIRRPMPRPPAPRALLGTEFHQWLEERFGRQRLIDPDDLLGAADDTVPEPSELALAGLRRAFEAGAWGSRWPVDVEVPFETLIAGRLVRGRIDAVFADAPGGGYDVVDWKTGAPPDTPADRRAVAVQLAAYRLAWAALAGVPVQEVRAAFYYVREDRTVAPADLLDERGLAALIESLPAAASRG
ncbi:MAG TPA: ATP-dependent DNA helicase [Streptosporangiaceae bacterium]